MSPTPKPSTRVINERQSRRGSVGPRAPRGHADRPGGSCLCPLPHTRAHRELALVAGASGPSSGTGDTRPISERDRARFAGFLDPTQRRWSCFFKFSYFTKKKVMSKRLMC